MLRSFARLAHRLQVSFHDSSIRHLMIRRRKSPSVESLSKQSHFQYQASMIIMIQETNCSNLMSIFFIFNQQVTNSNQKFFLLLLEYRGAEADLFWKAVKRHCSVERRSSRVRRSRSSHGPSRVYTEGWSHSDKVWEPKHATIFARCQQHHSKYDTRYEHQWIATEAHVSCVGLDSELQPGATTASAATKRDEHSQ